MIGDILRARYELQQELADTPLFFVFGAKDRLQSLSVCVRVLKDPYAAEPEFIEKLREVVAAVAAVRDPHLERAMEVDQDGDRVFVLSELSKGSLLNERLRKLGSLSVPVSVANTIAICEALHALHKQNLVHGDVGAHHVVMSSEGELKVQNAGLWQAYAYSATAGHAVLPDMAAYLAPEITRGSMPSPASDVYSVGVLLYEMLAGRRPFHADTPVAMALKHLNEAAPNVRMMNPSVPMVLAEIIKKCMGKDPAERYVDAGDLLTDLRILQDALKFGRTLAWPIREEKRAAAMPKLSEAQPVAPKMSALRTDPPPKAAPKAPSPREQRKLEKAQKNGQVSPVAAEVYEPDVPVWIKTLIAFFAGLLVVLVAIYVVFNINKPKSIKVPDLRRLTFSEASSRLGDLGLRARVQKRVTDENVPAEQIVRSNPAPGDTVYEGATISLTVSLGSTFVQVPDLAGVDIEQARQMVAAVGLKVDPDVINEFSTRVKKGIVLSQIPVKGAKVARTTNVKLTVSQGPKPRNEGTQSNLYSLEITLTNIEEPIRFRAEIEDARGRRRVYEANHEPGELVPLSYRGYGKLVRFDYFYDNQLVSSTFFVDGEKATEAAYERAKAGDGN